MDSIDLFDVMQNLAVMTKQPSRQITLSFTDGNDDYAYVLPRCFPLGLIDYGQLIKVKAWASGAKRTISGLWGFFSW